MSEEQKKFDALMKRVIKVSPGELRIRLKKAKTKKTQEGDPKPKPRP
jgi:hypothetical protein